MTRDEAIKAHKRAGIRFTYTCCDECCERHHSKLAAYVHWLWLSVKRGLKNEH
jgi:hypothetical protein